MFELNNREIAILLWLGGLLFWAMWRSEGVRKSMGGVFRAFANHLILIPFGLAGAYAAGCVFLLWKIGLWEWANLKTTVLWLLTFAFVTMAEVVQSKAGVKKLKAVAKDTFSATVVVLFVGEFYTFPLWAEILLVPSLTVIAMMLVMAEYKPEHAIIIKPLTFIQSAAGLGILGYSLFRIAQDFGAFATETTGREFTAPILLSLMFLPFLYCLMLYSAYEMAAVRLRFPVKDKALQRYAFWRALLSFRTDIDLFQRFVRNLNIHAAEDRPAVDRMISDLVRLKRREKSPPAVPWSAGWSPYEARTFLAAHDLVTNDYHPSFDDWWAESPMKDIGGGLFHDHLTYRIFGTEHAVTRLKLVLNANRPGKPEQSEEMFKAAALALAARALGDPAAEQFRDQWEELSSGPLTFADVAVSMGFDEWGTAQRGGYERRLVLRHKAHVPSDTEMD